MGREPSRIVELRMNKTRPDSYLTKYIPDFFDYKTVLYIGIEKYRCVFIKNLVEHGYIIDLLEIWKPHADHYREANKKLCIFRDIYNGDVRKIDEVIIGKKYDVVFWFHGPEHILKDQIPETFNKIKKYTKKLLVMACPHGESESPARDGNIYNEHYCALYPQDFIDLGFNAISENDVRIKAWWRNEKDI